MITRYAPTAGRAPRLAIDHTSHAEARANTGSLNHSTCLSLRRLPNAAYATSGKGHTKHATMRTWPEALVFDHAYWRGLAGLVRGRTGPPRGPPPTRPHRA